MLSNVCLKPPPEIKIKKALLACAFPYTLRAYMYILELDAEGFRHMLLSLCMKRK